MLPFRVRFFAPLLLLSACAVACQDTVDQPVPTIDDVVAVTRLLRQSSELIESSEGVGAVFARKSELPLTTDERAKLLGLWAPYIDHELAFRSYKLRYLRRWSQAPDEVGQVRALVVGLAAQVAQMRGNVKLLTLVGGQTPIRAVLDEASADYGVSAGHFTRIQQQTAAPESYLLLQTGTNALKRRAKKLLATRPPPTKAPCDPKAPDFKMEGCIADLIDKTLEAAVSTEALYDRRATKLIVNAVSSHAAATIAGAVSPMITEIALWMGDTRIRQAGKSLITRAQIDEMQKLMLPGDLVVERRNWYLSNLGLPGFWPHAELYVGTAAEMTAMFDGDAAVKKAYPKGFAAHLAEKYPAAWTQFQALAHDGEPHRILEAISEGVTFSSLPEATLADYVGVVRPRLTKVERAKAIAQAFSHIGKQYDFDFDFATLSILVCSEVVYKAYQLPAADGKSLQFDLIDVMGRQTLPPSDMVARFDRELGTPAQQLDFVAFLDGSESTKSAVFANVDVFRKSWSRPKWDLDQE